MNEMDIPDFGRVPQAQDTPEIRQMNADDGKTFVNPELPVDIQAKILAVPTHDLAHPKNPTSMTMSASLVQAVLNPVTWGAGGASILFGLVEGLLPVAGGVVVTLVAGSYVKNRVIARSRFKAEDHAGTGYIRTEWIRSGYANFVKKVAATADSIMETQVVKDDKIDRARLETRLPQMVWDITHTMFEVSVMRTALEEAATDDQGNRHPISKAQDAALKSVAHKMMDRHSALVQFLRRVNAADEQYRALRAMEKTEGFDSRIFDLLARTATQQSELDEINQMSMQAQAVTEAYRAAVDAALDSMNAVLELEK